MSDIPDELVERMVKLVQWIENNDTGAGKLDDFDSQTAVMLARSIVEELPKPIDPDLMEAEALVAADGGFSIEVIRDNRPNVMAVDLVLKGIKLGRELERGQ